MITFIRRVFKLLTLQLDMNAKTLTFDEFLPMLATISKQQDPGTYEDFVEVRLYIYYYNDDIRIYVVYIVYGRNIF